MFLTPAHEELLAEESRSYICAGTSQTHEESQLADSGTPSKKNDVHTLIAPVLSLSPSTQFIEIQEQRQVEMRLRPLQLQQARSLKTTTKSSESVQFGSEGCKNLLVEMSCPRGTMDNNSSGKVKRSLSFAGCERTKRD